MIPKYFIYQLLITDFYSCCVKIFRPKEKKEKSDEGLEQIAEFVSDVGEKVAITAATAAGTKCGGLVGGAVAGTAAKKAYEPVKGTVKDQTKKGLETLKEHRDNMEELYRKGDVPMYE